MSVKRNKEIKLIALDMDGTLLNENQEVSVANREAIRRAEAKGVTVILSTGRSILTCYDYAKSLNLLSHLITVNGSEIWEKEGKLLERNTVQTELIQWMWDLSQTYETQYWATSSDNVWRNQMPDRIADHQWLKFGFEIENQKIRERVLKQLLNQSKLEISNSSPINIEINAAGVNKGNAIEKVCKQLNLSMEHVMAIGDSLNDMAMIKKSGLGIAMGNAQTVVKESADWVTAVNNEDGVAEAINTWVL
ncbi:Cof-type HAD-IIB family hydrolase [Bacillus tuaregi]|uniref:Cof-type HAD-IIB family hydrolase n=1 Tax=Bacillus tuaregi TaxID=1816695 RepID=UPI0008F960F3|nr:Cof-type HAD-IIB family hydrolase [Bacillus tuaregi]